MDHGRDEEPTHSTPWDRSLDALGASTGHDFVANEDRAAFVRMGGTLPAENDFAWDDAAAEPHFEWDNAEHFEWDNAAPAALGETSESARLCRTGSVIRSALEEPDAPSDDGSDGDAADEPAPGWIERVDASTGISRFHNTKTGATAWQRPVVARDHMAARAEHRRREAREADELRAANEAAAAEEARRAARAAQLAAAKARAKRFAALEAHRQRDSGYEADPSGRSSRCNRAVEGAQRRPATARKSISGGKPLFSRDKVLDVLARATSVCTLCPQHQICIILYTLAF